MDMNTLNVSATLNIFRLLARPTLVLPQATVSTFNHLPIPLNSAFEKYKNADIRAVVLDKDNCFAYPKSNDIHEPYNVRLSTSVSYDPQIWAIYTKHCAPISMIFLFFIDLAASALLSLSQTKHIMKSSLDVNPYQDNFKRLREAYPGRRLLVVSNTAGAKSLDRSGKLAAEVEKLTGVAVLPHASKKPGCGSDIMEYFARYPETGVTRPDQIAIVGDRLTTDVMMANLMGSYSVWIKDGVVPVEETSVVSTLGIDSS